MTHILPLIIAIIPVIALLIYFEKQDKGKKEPLKLKWKVFKWGIFATLLAAFIEINFDWFVDKMSPFPIVYYFLTAFVTAGIVEEGLKFWVVKRIVFKHKEFDEIMDGITYAIIASLGFALLENILYVLNGGLAIAIIRALISVPAHAFFSGIMGYYIGKAKFAQFPWQSRKLLWKGFLIAVFYHGMFNFLLFTESILALLVIPLVITMGLHLRTKIRRARFEDKVDKTEPEKFTATKVVKIFLGSIMSIIGISSFIGSIVFAYDPAYDYGTNDIIYSAMFASVLLFFTYLLFRKKPPIED